MTKIGLFTKKKKMILKITKNQNKIVKLKNNGAGRAENMVVSDIVQLQETNYIEVFAANNTSVTNITVEDMNVIVERLN